MEGLETSDEDDSDVEDWCDLLQRCWYQLRALCKKMCRGRYDLVDDMMGEVVDRLPAIEATWDPTWETPLRAHMFKNVRWYLWKWMNRRMRLQVERFEPLDPDHPSATQGATREVLEQVLHVLERVSEEHREVLELHYLMGMTFAEVADEMGITRHAVRRLHQAALIEALNNNA